MWYVNKASLKQEPGNSQVAGYKKEKPGIYPSKYGSIPRFEFAK